LTASLPGGPSDRFRPRVRESDIDIEDLLYAGPELNSIMNTALVPGRL
jgi:hypothetical protein